MSRFGLKFKAVTQDVEIHVTDATKFRKAAPVEVDSKGRPKPFKPDPKDPDRRLGGLKGSMDDIKEGRWVLVNLSRTKSGWHMAKTAIDLGEEAKSGSKKP